MPLAMIGEPIKPLRADRMEVGGACAATAAGWASELAAFCVPLSALLSVDEVPLLATAWPTAEACWPCPAGLVFSVGSVSGVSADEAADAAAEEAVIAAAS